MLKKGDIYLFGVLVLAIVAGYLYVELNRSNDGGLQRIAVIKHDDKVIRSINLSEVQKPERIVIHGAYENVILVEKGRIRFLDADCPDRVCVKTGWLQNTGETAVCLPNRSIVKIEGGTNKVDILAY